MYTVINFASKKELREAVAQNDVKVQRYTNSGPFAESAGPHKCIEGPHYPKPHKFYAEVEVIEREGELLIAKGSKVK
jgi:hypothetical protein